MSNVDPAARVRELECTIDHFRKEMSDVRALAEKIRPTLQVQSAAYDARDAVARLQREFNKLQVKDVAEKVGTFEMLADRICTLEVETVNSDKFDNLVNEVRGLGVHVTQHGRDITKAKEEIEELQTLQDFNNPFTVKTSAYLVKTVEALLEEFEGGEAATDVLSELRLKDCLEGLQNPTDSQYEELMKAEATNEHLLKQNKKFTLEIRNLRSLLQEAFNVLEQSKPTGENVAARAVHKSMICKLSLYR